MKRGTDADSKAKTAADHVMKCPGCGEWFDMRDLGEVAKHVHDGDFEISEINGARSSWRSGAS